MHHMNLVRLCGYCSEGLLCSWEARERLLDWSTRFSIATATAQGIAYFHKRCRSRIIHCDIKPENILIDYNFCPKVSDFGLAKLIGREHLHVVTMVRGSRGYLAPEWVSNWPITVKADGIFWRSSAGEETSACLMMCKTSFTQDGLSRR
ncbi:G-type lectin S-receptor-like serine/threonine-protein kinase At5g24080 [Mercurialis annua]|uniref:G-type lectin S-receptor-like serine/threonine-protein kinase At5g24080 n=1 Tax=Mercurialis annua TaxID=3986 RepID=UPI0024AE29DC|nr:G-type lectin S-receptor-like serine/threonine-protein kinase At5g24080 [Mercurialis annua]